MKSVLVIIVTHNGKPWLDRCLSSVLTPEQLKVDVYVWDNDSTDGTPDLIQARYPVKKLIRSADNLGFSVPNNKGIEYALERGYDYVYLLNQDAWLEEGALEKLVTVAEAHPEYGLLSPMQMTEGCEGLDVQFGKVLRRALGGAEQEILRCAQNDKGIAQNDKGIARDDRGSAQNDRGSVRDDRGSVQNDKGSVRDDRGSVRDDREGETVVEVKRVMAAHWLIPTWVIRRVGPLEEELFPMWGQDDDWCHCLHYCGLKVGVVPAAKAVHDRACRKEPVEKLVQRNYYTGSLVRLCDVNHSLFLKFLFVVLFTFVKAVKYRSWLPFSYFVKICKQLPKVKERRSFVRTRAHIAE